MLAIASIVAIGKITLTGIGATATRVSFQDEEMRLRREYAEFDAFCFRLQGRK
jgi:hypothetical protein